jgi:hypothetical protein
MTVTITASGVHKIVAGTAQEVIDALVALNNPQAVSICVDSSGKLYVLTRA